MSPAPVLVHLLRDPDVVRARQAALELARALALPPRAQARVDLVVAELGTNVVRHAGRGTISVAPLSNGRAGIAIRCTDDGPGFPPAGEAVRPGEQGLGLGLAAAAELANVLTIRSTRGEGTSVEAEIWA